MRSHKPGVVTQLLRAAENGDQTAKDDLWSLVYAELHSLARRHLAHDKCGKLRSPTSIVSEAYLRLAPDLNGEWSHRGHFFTAAANAMRRILVDYARMSRSQKRGGDVDHVPLSVEPVSLDGDAIDVLSLDDALARLERLHPDHAQVVMLRYFGGLTIDESAEALEVSSRTVSKRWQFARSWLRRELTPGEANGQVIVCDRTAN